MKKLLKYLLIITLLLSLAAFFVPWKNVIEEKIKSEIEARGISGFDFSIESLGFEGITLKDVVFKEYKLPSVVIVPLEWQGKNIRSAWKITEIILENPPIELPHLSANGELNYTGNNVLLAGDIYSADEKTKAKFLLNYPVSDSKLANIKIESATLPWNGGVISAQNISAPIHSNKSVLLTLNVKKIPLNNLLSAATSNRATATGVVSGTIPVTINRDGTFKVRKGNLKAENAGTLKLSPDVIPSSAEQVALLREVLQDFHYSVFSMGIDSADNKKLVMLLSLEGNNPAVYNGRVVKLNVHLSGDVLEMITQSLNLLK